MIYLSIERGWTLYLDQKKKKRGIHATSLPSPPPRNMVLKWIWSQALHFRKFAQKVVIVNELPPTPSPKFFSAPPPIPSTVNVSVKASRGGFIGSVCGVLVSCISCGDYMLKETLKQLQNDNKSEQQLIADLKAKEMELEIKKQQAKIRADKARSKLWFFQKLWYVS